MFKKKQAKKLNFAPKITLRVERSDPARNSFFPADFLSAPFRCSQLPHNCVKITVVYRRARGERGLDIAQTIGLNCSMTHSPGKIEYNCRYFIMTFRTQIHKKKFVKKCFRTLQGTMSHRPLTNTSSLKIAAAYWRYSHSFWYFQPSCELLPLSPSLWFNSPPPFPVLISIMHTCIQCVRGGGGRL